MAKLYNPAMSNLSSNPLISIVIPVFNVEEYLRECVDSVIAQTYANLEIILVDDGSQDSSGKVCDQYSEEDSRIITIHQENKGLSEARNTGIKASSGEYIYFLDSDDYITADCIEKLVRPVLEKEYDIVESYYRMLYGSVPIVKLSLPSGEVAAENILDAYCRRMWTVHAWNKLIRRDFITTHNLYFVPEIIYEDDVWSFMAACNAQSLFVLNEVTYVHRSRPGSIMTTIDQEESIKARVEVLKHVSRYRDEMSLRNNCSVLVLVLSMCNKLERSLRSVSDVFLRKRCFMLYVRNLSFPVFYARRKRLIGWRAVLYYVFLSLPSEIAFWGWERYRVAI